MTSTMFDAPEGARPMQAEFARRIRSFIKGDEWKDIMEKARTDMGCGALSALVLAAVPDPTDEDMSFASAINWCVARNQIDLNNVVTDDYAAGNWWYVDSERGDPSNASLIIWGVVRVQLKQHDSEEVAEAKAKAFASAMINRSAWAQDPPGVVTLTPQHIEGHDDVWDIAGRLWLKR